MPSGRRRVDDDERPRRWRWGCYDPAHILTGTADACQATLLAIPVCRDTLEVADPRSCLRGCFASVYLPRDRSLTGRVISRETSCRRKRPNLACDFTRIARGKSVVLFV